MGRVTNRVEIWRDDPDSDGEEEVVREIAGEEVKIRGRGKIRAVVLFRERTDKHERYRERLNLHVLEKLDDPKVVRVRRGSGRSSGGLSGMMLRRGRHAFVLLWSVYWIQR